MLHIKKCDLSPLHDYFTICVASLKSFSSICCNIFKVKFAGFNNYMDSELEVNKINSLIIHEERKSLPCRWFYVLVKT